ncbi:MAG: hypothetical protein K8S56_09080 [Candidatus Cloacimonetes bacterium]|nr:hypothetical protein [Candidatus Cloacimonadota bacterium]
MDSESFKKLLTGLNPRHRYILYGEIGNIEAIAIKMGSLRIRHLYILEGGVEDWKSMGYKTESGPDKKTEMQKKEVRFIAPTSVYKLTMDVERSKDIILIDLRSFAEWESGQIPMSTCLPFEGREFENEIIHFDKKQRYILYSKQDNISVQAAQWMQAAGFERVEVMKKGLAGWLEKGFKLKKK